MIEELVVRAGTALAERHGSLPRHRAVPSLEIRSPNGHVRRIGTDEPAFAIIVRDERGASALLARDQLAVALAYVEGSLDIDGDMVAALSARDLFHDRHLISQVRRFIGPLVRGQVASDRRFIAAHYDMDPEFFLSFMDSRHRCYSHAVYLDQAESLEDAMTRKLDLALEAIGVKPGDHVLEIGGGWGAFVEHAGLRGVRVTTLTLSRESESYLRHLIADRGLPAEVVREHVFRYRPGRTFDAIVNMGVTEHLPDYRATLRAYGRLLAPGGRIYLDAVATRAKYRVSTYFSRYIYPGNATPVVLHSYLAAVARSPFELVSVHDDTASYQRTCEVWAQNLDAAREEIVSRWGEHVYRRFRLFLWGSADAFATRRVQACRWVLSRP
jgi:cyclopropane-fatty-acyl-phospholipid synthase